jgi:hypothetical protein
VRILLEQLFFFTKTAGLPQKLPSRFPSASHLLEMDPISIFKGISGNGK